jgi:hypothetical protein
MTRPRRSRLDDPTAEHSADPVPERSAIKNEDLVRRTAEERDYTPRRYEQSMDEDPLVPSEKSKT